MVRRERRKKLLHNKNVDIVCIVHYNIHGELLIILREEYIYGSNKQGGSMELCIGND